MSTPNQTPASQGGTFSVYARAVRRHPVVVLLTTLLAIGAAVAWLTLREPEYEATAQVLVTPLSLDDQTYSGLRLLRDSGDDPTRALKTAATILDSPRAAQRTAQQLGAGWTIKRVREQTEVTPQGESSLLEITGTSDKAGEAARLSNTFTRVALDLQLESLRTQAAATLTQLRARQSGASTDPVQAQRIAQLETLRDGDDPTLALTQQATAPPSPSGPGTTTIIVLSLVAGLTLGVAAAILLELLNRRIRDEEEAVEVYPLPVLTRVPITPQRKEPATGSAWVMPPPVHEAFRTIFVQMSAWGAAEGRTIMVTSATTGDGKTTSAVNLAASIAASGSTVILIDFDIRRPAVAGALGVEAQPLIKLVTGDLGGGNLKESLAPVPGLPNLSVLATTTVMHGELGLVEAVLQRLPAILKEARAMAEYVVIDTAPLGEVSDALRIADQVDHIVVVVRPTHTDRANLEVMKELLERTRHAPAGMLIIGDAPGGASTRYYDQGMAVRQSAPA